MTFLVWSDLACLQIRRAFDSPVIARKIQLGGNYNWRWVIVFSWSLSSLLTTLIPDTATRCTCIMVVSSFVSSVPISPNLALLLGGVGKRMQMICDRLTKCLYRSCHPFVCTVHISEADACQSVLLTILPSETRHRSASALQYLCTYLRSIFFSQSNHSWSSGTVI